MKKIALIILAIGSLTWISCNNSGEKTTELKDQETTAHNHNEGEHKHTYSCPMGCEGSESDKPGKCPKCGMDLVHTDHESNGKKYRMDFRSEPSEIEANKAGVLYFTPKEDGNDKALVPLDLVHEKRMHLIIVNEDLSYFEHIHPEYNSDGTYRISVLDRNTPYAKGIGQNETRFPAGGKYIMFQDYSPTGAGHKLGRIPLEVKGEEKPSVKYEQEDLTWAANGYQVLFSFDKNPLKVNQSAGLKVTISKNGKPVSNLENYLGALGHMVVIHENTEEYLHVHPMDSDKMGPEITFHSTFTKPGIYRAFLQFLHEGKIQTADFVLNVQQ